MRHFIRIIGFISFTAAAFLFAGCGTASPGPVASSNVNRPLVMPEAAVKRPKIIALGDSLTAGFGLAENESYPYLLQNRLEADGFNYEVVNAGVSGDTSLGGLERADWVLDQENVEVLVLELGANDLLRGMPVDKMKQNLGRIIEKAKAKNVKVLLCGMLAPPTMGAEYQKAYTNAFPDLASEHKVEYLPFLLEGVALKRELNQADGIHPNAEGTKIMTENIYAKLRPMLKQ
ncbi:MAG: arylesterase [Pyrinomonadaceae bacterium]|nr:arylesterase [Pyrinomonadaceae bacterium]